MGERARRRDGSSAPQRLIAWRLPVWPAAPILWCIAVPARADTSYSALVLEHLRSSQDLVGLSLLVGLVMFSVVTALLHLRETRKWTQQDATYTAELNNLRARFDRAQVFLTAEPQIIVAWGGDSDAEIEGDLSLVTDQPVARRILGFGSWLPPETAQQLESCVEKLRERGEAFHFVAESLAGRTLELDGRPVSGRAVMRIRDVSGDRLEATRLRERLLRTYGELDALHALLDSTNYPVWLRDRTEKLAWVNAAYVRAVEAKDSADALLRGTELLERTTRDQAIEARAAGTIWRGRAAAVAAGQRHLLDVIEVPVSVGSAGLAADASQIEALRTDMARLTKAHAATLDQLSTAVAIFDRRKRLVFHNSAYRQLWSLPPSFLDENPSDSEILDRLRAARLLPEQADFRAWKESLLSAYQAFEASEQVWYLPDGRTLRVVINPNPQGITYLFDDVTERFHLESRFNALTRVQSETLDTLKEGVAVFGTDGRLNFFNPAFARLLKLDPAQLNDKPHVDRLASLCTAFGGDDPAVVEIRAVITGLDDQRNGYDGRIFCNDGTVLDCTAQPLPDGATLLTFTDTTASVNVERALTDRNTALIDAERLRNDFVHHVSYELRSPLTNIIGFIELLGDSATGPLNDKQKQYAGYVTTSSSALLAIIDNILDLASIDADALELKPEKIDIRETISLAAQGVQDRLAESSIHLKINASDDVGTFIADGQRIRQILFNLLSNAIGFSEPGQTVTLSALRRADEIILNVADQGRGIPPDVIDEVFKRFKTNSRGSRHHGVGLGLSIVRSLVELHGGHVEIESAPNRGTLVTCVFPGQAAT
ncbi:MAG: PAS-domain containing protein [Methylovirgula sp.]|uniref:sensor histidine kinase n=1 Tax=Methylovirgula sp. TaxID=1978224 RepID=UPI0030760795